MFLWVTTPLKIDIAESGIVKRWGYDYKTTLYWRKKNFGLGHWFRGVMEECWVCTRGKVPPLKIQKANIIECKAEKHSRKPVEFFELIEPRLDEMGFNDRLELFARKRRPGYYCYGNEVKCD